MDDSKIRNVEINNVIIENKKLKIDLSIDIDLISNYLEHFKSYKNFTNNNITPSIELIYIISIIQIKNDLVDVLKFLDFNIVKKEFAIDFLKTKKIIDILKIYDEIKDFNYIKEFVEEVINEYLSSIYKKEILNNVINYNLKFYLPNIIDYINDNINNYYSKDLYSIYFKNMFDLIDKKKLYDDHIILGLPLFIIIHDNNYINKIINMFNNIENYDYYLDDLKILLKNKNYAIAFVYKNIYNNNNNILFDYIYNIHKNNSFLESFIDFYEYKLNCINSIKINYLNIFITYDFYKIEILEKYIDGNYFKIDCLDIINYIINDDKLSEKLIEKFISIKSNNGNFIFDLYEYFKNENNNDYKSIKYENIKSFVYKEYEIENKELLDNIKLLEPLIIKKIPYIFNFDFDPYKFLSILKGNYTKFKYVSLILSKKIIFRNLNLKDFTIYYFNSNYKYNDIFFTKIINNIEENFIKDIEESGLNYILTTDKTEENLHIFDKNIEFKTDYVSSSLGFIIKDFDILIYILKHIKNDNSLLCKFILYNIRYNNYDVLNYIEKYNKKQNFINEYCGEYYLINYAYTRETINLIKKIYIATLLDK